MTSPELHLPALARHWPDARRWALRWALRTTAAAALAAALLPLSGCVVVPPHPGYVAPVGVAYVAPTYAIPAPGYVWAYHPRYGWGWRHPELGWHRGWR